MSARKRGLGRGLDALIEDVPQPSPQPTPLVVPVDQLKPNRRQPRSTFDEEGLQELADSIRAQGVIQPLIVSQAGDGSYQIVAGERRWRAARRAGLAEVPVVVREAVGDRELLEVALVENLQRTDLDALEEAQAFRSLAEEHGLSHEEIGRRVGRSRPAISNSLRLLQLPEEIQTLLREGRLTAGQARPLLALEGEAQLRLARLAVAEGLSARAIEQRVQRATRGPRARRAAEPDVHAQAAAERLTRELQTRVEIRRRGTGGEIRIRFHNEEELMRLYDKIARR
ncbi:MAG: ParB/RepB/Spo0J family partition protein [Thermoanaerobaculia bacterium]